MSAPRASVTRIAYSPANCTLLRGPVEPGQYTSEDYPQQLDDAKLLASVGSVGDCYDKALVS
jgi:hypothetical protein